MHRWMDCESSAAVLTAAHLNASNRSAHQPQNPANPAWWYGRVAHSRACVCVLRAAHCTDDAQSAQGTPTLTVCLFVCLFACLWFRYETRESSFLTSAHTPNRCAAACIHTYTHARTHEGGSRWFGVLAYTPAPAGRARRPIVRSRGALWSQHCTAANADKQTNDPQQALIRRTSSGAARVSERRFKRGTSFVLHIEVQGAGPLLHLCFDWHWPERSAARALPASDRSQC